MALRASHAHASAADVLDLVMQGRQYRLVDFGDHMLPPAPFALLVAEVVGDHVGGRVGSVHRPEGRRQLARHAAASIRAQRMAEVPGALLHLVAPAAQFSRSGRR